MPRLAPRLVVVNIFTPNDYSGTVTDNNYGFAKSLFRVQDGELTLSTGEIREHNCINRLSRSLLFHFLWKLGETRSQWRESVTDLLRSLCGSTVLDLAEGRRVVRELFRRIARLASERHADLLFVLMPNRAEVLHADNPGSVQLGPAHRFFSKLLRQDRYDTLDFAATIRESSFCHPDCDLNALFIDDLHLTPTGGEFLADVLCEHIRERYGVE
jgi:hypothetical protein